jgi:hypothetical protein
VPLLRRVARATRSGRRAKGSLKLTIDRSDSEHPSYRGCFDDGSTSWDLGLGKPYGWDPDEGEWRCEVVFLSDVRGPALIVLDHGLLFPTKLLHKWHGRRS